jgi:hypothetical protein
VFDHQLALIAIVQYPTQKANNTERARALSLITEKFSFLSQGPLDGVCEVSWLAANRHARLEQSKNRKEDTIQIWSPIEGIFDEFWCIACDSEECEHWIREDRARIIVKNPHKVRNNFSEC